MVAERSFSINPVPDAVLKNHELFVLKTTLSILHNTEFLSGKLNEQPLKRLSLPSFTIKERLSDNRDSYVLGKGDQNGETKIDLQGHLKGGRYYLFQTFMYSCPENNNSKNLYVMVTDLIKALNIAMDESSFLSQYADLYPIPVTDPLSQLFNERSAMTNDVGVTTGSYVTARSAFLVFGAAVLASGSRVIDDYWEQLSKDQGFQAQHRVYVLNEKLLRMIYAIEPKAKQLQNESAEQPIERDSFEAMLQNNTPRSTLHGENPFLILTELPPMEHRQSFVKSMSHGDPTAVIAGQTIHGSIELSNIYKVPKYHYKNSFAYAQQNNVLDTPIGTHTHPVESHNFGRGRKANSFQPETTDVLSQIPGWKFSQLSLTTDTEAPISYCPTGLPVYKKESLPTRLKLLTPNQIKDLERSHDVVHLNTALGQVRKLRNTRWTKYWQHKSGAPIGFTNDKLTEYRKEYLTSILNHVEVNVVPNDMKNVDEKHTVKRVPNPNFLGYSNISGFPPPFVDKR